MGLTWTTNAIKTVSGSFQDAAMLGVTVFVASGDQGSNCGIGDKKAHVLYPGSDPFVTSCGALFHGSVIWRRGVDGIGERARS